jgi:hypothetical protein
MREGILQQALRFLKTKEGELFLLSLSSLFVELIFIRWLAADFRSLCVFKTFPLATCLVGLGAGSALAQNEELANKWFGRFPFVLYLATIAIRVLSLTYCAYFFLPSINLYQWSSVTAEGTSFILYQLFFMAFLVTLLAGPFYACYSIGARIGVLFNGLPPLKAYCINVGGAVLGSILFLISCYSWMPLWGMFLIPVAVALIFLPKISNSYRNRSFLLLFGAVLAVGLPTKGPEVYWSPYSKIEAFPIEDTLNGATQRIGTLLNMGRTAHQVFLPKTDLEPGEQMTSEYREVIAWHQSYFDILYTLCPHPRNVLVLGGGMGNDSWNFLKRGVDSIDTVEIDPLIADLGRKSNPAFSSDKVHIIVDDARHYVKTCTKKYDLVLLSYLDSSTLAGLSSSTRVDSYVHTKESFKAIKQLLTPDGVMALSFGSGGYKWLRERIRHTLEAAFGYPPLVYDGASFLFFTGEPIQKKLVNAPAKLPLYAQVAPTNEFDGKILNDDWPFLYMRTNQFDLPFAIVVLEVLALALFAGRKMLTAKDTQYWSMFFMGGAFMLVELCAISRLALIYSATAITASLVIITILLMILFANFLILKYGEKFSGHLNTAYGALIASLILVYFVPPEAVTQLNHVLDFSGNAALTVFSLLPCLFAAVVFALRFKKVSIPSRAIAFNLFGCVAGALLEYLSNFWGIRSLLLVAVVLYLCSWKAKD